jgi:hypothetical protein
MTHMLTADRQFHREIACGCGVGDVIEARCPGGKALHTIDIHLTETIDQARLPPKTA